MAASSYYQLNQFPPGHHEESYTGHTVYASQPYDNQHATSHHGKKPKVNEPFLDPNPLSDSELGPQAHVADGTDRLDERKTQKSLRRQRIVKLATKATTVVFTSIMLGIMLYMLIIFNQTKNVIRDGRGPWPSDSKVWPTYMLLAASALSLLVAVVSLVFYCCNYERAQQSWKLALAKNVMHVLIWITVSAIYRYEKNLHEKPNDLWGWACSPKAQAIQAEFQSVINFKPLCTAQVSFCSQQLSPPSVLDLTYSTSQARGDSPSLSSRQK